jgi:hypothetical protein
MYKNKKTNCLVDILITSNSFTSEFPTTLQIKSKLDGDDIYDCIKMSTHYYVWQFLNNISKKGLRKMKNIKKYFMFIAVFTLIIFNTLTIYAEHKIPNTNLPCNNTYYDLIDGNYYSNTPGNSHVLTNGTSCNITILIYTHTNKCTSCSAIVGTGTHNCSEQHSNSACGMTRKLH